MSNKNKNVDRWVKKRQSCCPYIRWERMECRAMTPICLHAQRNGEKCIYKYCPLNSQS